MTAIFAQLSSASGVEAPKCGTGMTLSMVKSSSSGKSVTYAATIPSLMAHRRSLVTHQTSPSEIKNPHSLFHDGEFVLIDHGLGLVVKRHMERDIIALGQKPVEAH